MQELRKQMKIDLELKNYSPKTEESCLWYVECFAKHFGKSPGDIGEIRAFGRKGSCSLICRTLHLKQEETDLF